MSRLIKCILFSVIFISSCSKKSDNIVISNNFQNEEWPRFEYLNGEMKIDKAPVKYDVIMEIAVSDEYPNIYNVQDDCSLLFNLTIKNPEDSGSRSRDYRFTLKDKDGNWKADKVDGYYVFRLPIISEMTFSEKGLYNFKLENKYPKDPLYGIKSLSLMCVESK